MITVDREILLSFICLNFSSFNIPTASRAASERGRDIAALEGIWDLELER